MKALLLATSFALTGVFSPAFTLADATPSATLLADEKQEEKTYEGVLETGIMGIGGETTGTILKTKDGQYELDVQGNAELQKAVEALNGKKVTVVGVYKPRPGVEVKERKIIVVTALKEAK